MALVLRSVNRIDWEELWRVICSSVWGEKLDALRPAAHSAGLKVSTNI